MTPRELSILEIKLYGGWDYYRVRFEFEQSGENLKSFLNRLGLSISQQLAEVQV
jgi:hypothetical protein